MNKVSLAHCVVPSNKETPTRMIAIDLASRQSPSVPFSRPPIPTLVSPLKHGLLLQDMASYEGEPDSPEIHQIQVSFSEASTEARERAVVPQQQGGTFFDLARMGQHLRTTGNYKLALNYYREALQCKHRSISTESPQMQQAFGDVLYDIGLIHLIDGLEEEAEKAKSKEAFYFCLDIRRMCLGSSHPDVASVLYQIALIHISSKDELQCALDMLLEALAIRLNVPSTTDNTQACKKVWTAIGKVQESLGQKEEALSSLQEAAHL